MTKGTPGHEVARRAPGSRFTAHARLHMGFVVRRVVAGYGE